MSEEIEINIQYKDLKVEISGDYDSVWKSVNEFFKKIREEFKPEGQPIFSTEGKDLPEIVIGLRDSRFFDQPRDCRSVHERIKELGKTDHTINAVAMQLKSLSGKGGLIRKSKEFFGLQGRGYAYVSPWYNLDQHR